MQKRDDFEAKLFKLLPRLRRFCHAMCGVSHDADDLLQSTVERLLVKPPPTDADAAKWMFRVCKNLWIDEIRARSVRSTEPLDPEMDLADLGGEQAMIDRLTLRETSEAMALLSDDQRAVLALVAIEGLSYHEAAEALEIPVGTVMSRLSRARAALAVTLRQTDLSKGPAQ